MSMIGDLLKRGIFPKTDMLLVKLINITGIIYILVWAMGIALLYFSGSLMGFYSIYYVVPLILGYYSFYLRAKSIEKTMDLDESLKSVASAFKISVQEARDYMLRKIENELFNSWLKFNILVYIVLLLIVGMFFI
ncbi:MAG: hypothetical protein ACP6IP_09780 [Candidatus Njordarchaeia archaeon]